MAKLTTRDLTPALWPAVEQLFGKNGACGGCWCMSWRVQQDERWEDIKGDEAKRRFEALVRSGEAAGVLAFEGDVPVGWAAYGPRPSFSKLDRARTLACDDADQVWSLPCFFIKAGHRGQGVATTLLAHAVDALRARGATIAEGYPVRPKKPGESIPAAFAWTGTRAMFEAQGFAVVGNEGGGKERVRLPLAGAKAVAPTKKAAKAVAPTKRAPARKKKKPSRGR